MIDRHARIAVRSMGLAKEWSFSRLGRQGIQRGHAAVLLHTVPQAINLVHLMHAVQEKKGHVRPEGGPRGVRRTGVPGGGAVDAHVEEDAEGEAARTRHAQRHLCVVHQRRDVARAGAGCGSFQQRQPRAHRNDKRDLQRVRCCRCRGGALPGAASGRSPGVVGKWTREAGAWHRTCTHSPSCLTAKPAHRAPWRRACRAHAYSRVRRNATVL